mgnify:CR=1 FL=1
MKGEEKEGKARGRGLLNKLTENENYRKIIIGAGLLGIALIFLSSYLKGGETSEAKFTPSGTTYSAEEYETRLEDELRGMIMNIQGAGNTSVMVTLEQTKQSVYAKQEKTSGQTTEDKSDGTSRNEKDSSNETSYIIVRDADGAEKAVAVTEIQPLIKGVVVVCDGADDPGVQQNVIDAVTTALDITSVRVCVIKAK